MWALGVTAIEALTGAHPLLPAPPPEAAPGVRAGGGGEGPAALWRVGRLCSPPRLDPAWRLPDGRLRAFLDGALALRRGEGAGGGGGAGRWDAAGATPRRLLGRLRLGGCA